MSKKLMILLGLLLIVSLALTACGAPAEEVAPAEEAPAEEAKPEEKSE